MASTFHVVNVSTEEHRTFDGLRVGGGGKCGQTRLLGFAVQFDLGQALTRSAPAFDESAAFG